MTKVRGGIRPQARLRRSDTWQTPKPSEGATASAINGDAAAALFAGSSDTPASEPQPETPPPFMVDPEVNLDQDMPSVGSPANGDVIITSRGAGYVAPVDLFASSLGGDRVTAKPAALQLAKVGPIEIDRLWDWARADRDGVMNFLGFIPDHSLHLYKWIDNFQGLEREGRARFHSIYVAGSLIGFLMLHPIQQTGAQAVADCHLYLSQDARGNVRSLLPQLLAELDRIVPYIALRVVTARDDEWARLLRGVGFAAQIVLTRPAAAMTGNASGS